MHSLVFGLVLKALVIGTLRGVGGGGFGALMPIIRT